MKVFSKYGTLRGFLVRKDRTKGLFFQVDKNNQICDILTAVKGGGVKDRIRGPLYDNYKGRPFGKKLFQELIEIVTNLDDNE